MWTKSEDLQNKYVKLSFQQDYETVTKVLHEFGFKMYDGIFNDGYYESYPFLNFYSDNTYYTSIDSSRVNTEIPIQQFYDYLKPKTLKVEDLVDGEVYRSVYGYNWLFKYNENNDETVYYLTPTSFSKSSWGFYKNKTITPCSSEDKLWLEACIKADKFIFKEEALIPKGFTPYNIIPEYVECIKAFLKQEVGDIEKTSEVPKWTYGWTKERFWKDFYKDYYKPSTKEAYEAKFKSTDTNWIPEVGEYAVMVNAGGWSYSSDNNGCVAKITGVNAKQFYNGVKTYTIAGKLINPKTSDYNSFNSIPLINSNKKLICRKAESHEIPNNNEVVLTPKTFDLSNTKIRVNTPELSKLVQKKAFELGWSWVGGKKVKYTEEPFLYFWNNKFMAHWGNENYFKLDTKKEIFPSDLGINIVNKEIRSIVNVGKNEYPVTSNEVFQQEGLIDTNVNKIQSVSVELYQPEELQLF